MRPVSVGIALWAASVVLQQTTPQQSPPQSKPPALTPTPSTTGTESGTPQGETGDSSLLQRLYHLVWPLGHFQGDIAGAASRGSEKSAPGVGVSRLYLVNTRTGSIREWPSAAGAQQPTICPDSTSLFYRRDKRLFRERVRLTSDALIAAATPPQRLEVAVTWLYACTQDGKGGVSLWAENADGAIRVLRVRNNSAAWEDLPNDNTLHPLEPQKVVEVLRHFRSMRPDGFVVWIRDQQLLGQKRTDATPSLLVHSDLPFSGSPSWIGDSQFLFVTAETPD